MAASEKTPVLGLSLWAGTDKPRRADFVADHTALETVVGGHLNDGDRHLDEERRARLDAPIEVRTYTGTGAQTRSLVFPFSPSAVVVFAVGKGASVCTDGCTKHYAGFSAGGQHSLGVELSTVQVSVSQSQTEPDAGGSMAALNEAGVTYAILAFR
ncbi:MAG: hypothetical protein ACI4GO_05525 [Hominenteromicrobium sp.]